MFNSCFLSDCENLHSLFHGAAALLFFGTPRRPTPLSLTARRRIAVFNCYALSRRVGVVDYYYTRRFVSQALFGNVLKCSSVRWLLYYKCYTFPPTLRCVDSQATF